MKDGKIILPKYYCTSETSPIKLDVPKKTYEKINVEFCGELYPEQVESRNECIGFLNKFKSCILSLPVGCGKCLHPDTPILQYDGSTVLAKDVKRGHVLIGDDGTPRLVLSTTRGVDEMYSIVNHDYNVNYTVNSDHILTLVDMETHKVCDVSLKWLLEHPELVGIKYRGFRTSVDVWGNKTRKERMEFLNTIFHQYQQFTTSNVILKNKILQTAYSLGLSIKCKQVNDSYTMTISSGTPDIYPFVITCQGTGEYCGFELDGNGRFLLSDFTVTHNTATTINLSTKVKLKVLVIVNRLVLVQQWKEAIHQFCPGATIHMLKPKDAKKEELPTHFVFYIINHTRYFAVI